MELGPKMEMRCNEMNKAVKDIGTPLSQHLVCQTNPGENENGDNTARVVIVKANSSKVLG